MKKERMLYLLNNCIDEIVERNEYPALLLLNELDFTKEELIKLGFNECEFDIEQ